MKNKHIENGNDKFHEQNSNINTDKENVGKENTEKKDIEATTVNSCENNNIENNPEYKKIKDALLLALAENENLRKRFEKEKEDLLKYSVTKFAVEMLSVADNIQRALDNIDDTEQNKKIRDGILIMQKEVNNIFKKNKIEKITLKPGDTFDPLIHQAISEVKDDKLPKGSISSIVQEGYKISDRLLRPSLVITVSK